MTIADLMGHLADVLAEVGWVPCLDCGAKCEADYSLCAGCGRVTCCDCWRLHHLRKCLDGEVVRADRFKGEG